MKEATRQPELLLEIEAGEFPPGLFCQEKPYTRAWAQWRDESEDLDKTYPEERIETDQGVIYLVPIERGVWLWGVSVFSRAGLAGMGFPARRKWGPEHAAMSREAAYSAASLCIAEFLKDQEEKARRNQ